MNIRNTFTEAVNKAIDGVTAGVASGAAMLVRGAIEHAIGGPMAALAGMAFDKPNTVAAPVRTLPRSFPQLPHGEGETQGTQLSITFGKEPVVVPGLSMGEGDEMSLSVLANTPSMLDRVVVSSAATVGQLVFECPVNPKYVKPVAAGVYTPTMLSMAAVPFSYWRGSMRYKFYFFASAMTRAQLRVTFSPLDDAAPTIDNYADMMTRVFDVQGDTEVDIAIPFLYPRLFAGESIGRLTISVVSPVLPLGTLSDTPIYGLVYVAAGDGMVFRAPSSDMFLPEGSLTLLDTDPVALAESDVRADFRAKFEPIVAGATACDFTDPSFADAVDIRELLRRPMPFLASLRVGRVIDGQNSSVLIDVKPGRTGSPTFVFNRRGGAVPANAIAVGGAPYSYGMSRVNGSLYVCTSISRPSLIDHFASCYKFVRGGIVLSGNANPDNAHPFSRLWAYANYGNRYRRVISSADTIPMPLGYVAVGTFPLAMPLDAEDYDTNDVPTATFDVAASRDIEFVVPYNSPAPMMTTGSPISWTSDYGDYRSDCASQLVLLRSFSQVDMYGVMRSFADDTTFHYRRSPGRCYLLCARNIFIPADGYDVRKTLTIPSV